jgi:hypothetical protein
MYNLVTCTEQVSAAATDWFSPLEASVQEVVKKANSSLFSAFQPERFQWPTAVHSKSFLIRHSPFILLLILQNNSMEQSPSRIQELLNWSRNSSFFHGARRFITLFKTARHLSLCWIKFIQYRPFYIISLLLFIASIQPSGQFGQQPEPSQVTGMAVVRCILGKFLGVVCHCFSPLSL